MDVLEYEFVDIMHNIEQHTDGMSRIQGYAINHVVLVWVITMQMVNVTPPTIHPKIALPHTKYFAIEYT